MMLHCSHTVHGPRLAPFVLRSEGNFGVHLGAHHPASAQPFAHPSIFRVHFLDVQADRKVARQRVGHNIGNFRHRAARTLTTEEIRRRLQRFRNWAQSAPEAHRGGGNDR